MSTRVARPAPVMRKAPRQARSRTTVDVIVQAAARVLAERGWAGFTTNHVAERAGISIGSLYQYFPGKQSLIEAIRRLHLADVLAAVRSAGGRELSAHERAVALVDRLVAVHAASPGLHRALLEAAPRDAGPDLATFEADYHDAYVAVIAAARGRRAGAALSARVLAGAVEGAIHHAVRAGAIDAPAWRAEMIGLVARCLRDERPRQPLTSGQREPAQ